MTVFLHAIKTGFVTRDEPMRNARYANVLNLHLRSFLCCNAALTMSLTK